jgi:phage tail P2-like protein
MRHLEDYSIREDLPESLNRKNVKELASLSDEALRQYDSIIYRVLIYPVIDTLPSDLVNALAVQLHCDFYDYSLPLEKRRALVKESIAWHRIKGTPAAVERVVSAVFGPCHVSEWYEYGGKPYTFRVSIAGKDAFDDTSRDINQLLKAIYSAKNVRSWLDGGTLSDIHITIDESSDLPFGFVVPITQTRKVDWYRSNPSCSHPLGLGFLSDDTMRGIRPAIPEVVPAKDVRGFLLGSLFPAHLRAVHEPIELRRRSSGGRMTGIFAAVLWAGRRGVRQRLPAGCRTDAAVPCIVLPDTCLQSIRAAMPGKVHGGLSHAVLLGSLFPRHVGIRKQA